MSGVVRILGWLVPLSLAQAGIAAAGVWLALRALPRNRARLRHGIALGALAVVTVSVLATAAILLIDWNEHASCWSRAGEGPAPVSATCRSHGVPAPGAAGPVDPAERASFGLAWRSMIRVPSLPGELGIARGWTDVSGIVGWTWLAALLVLLLREIWIRRRIRRIRREAVPIESVEVGALLDDLVAELRIRVPVEVRESGAVDTPCVVGAGKATVLLPRGLLAALEHREVRGVLAHELAHVRGRDGAAIGLQRMAASLLAFNPFAVWISRRAREEREAACDRIGAEVGARSGTAYARTLLLLEGFRGSPAASRSLPALLGEGELVGRVKRILAGSSAGRRPGPAVLAALVLTAGALGGALVQASLAGASLGSWGVMAEDVESRREPACQNVDPSWSPDGRRIVFAYSCGSDELEIYRMDPDGSNVVRLTHTSGAEHGPVFSPDGSRIAYAYDPEGEDPEIWTMAADGSDARAVTGNEHTDWDPEWSPDGRRIAWESRRDGNVDVWVIDLETGAETRLTDHPDRDLGPAWSPEGSLVAFQSSRDGSYGIFGVSPDGGPARRLIELPGDAVAPSWSPDGRRLVFVYFEEDDGDLWVTGLDGGEPRPITRNDRTDFLPAWSPDGETIAFIVRGEGDAWDVWTIGVDGSNERRLTGRARSGTTP